MNIARSSVKLFLASGLNTGLGFVGITYFARELGAHDLGVFFLFQALLGMIALPGDFGVGGAIEKRISEGQSPGSMLASGIVVKSILLAGLLAVMFPLRGYINSYLGADLALLLAIAVIAQEAGHITVKVLSGELRVGETAVLDLANQVLWVGVGGILVTAGFGLWGLVYGLLAGLVAKLVWGAYRSSTPLSRPSIDGARSLGTYAKYSFLGSIGGYVYNWIDVAIIGLFLTKTDVGAYEVAWRVAGIAMLFSYAIGTTVFPQVSQWHAGENLDRIEELLPRALTGSLALVIPSFFGIVVLARDVLVLVFGEEYAIAWLVLIVLTGEKIFQAIHVVLGHSLEGLDKPRLAAQATVAAIIINILLNVALVASFGLIGAAVATTVSFGVNSLLSARYMSRFISLRFPFRNVSWFIISSLVMTLVLVTVRTAIGVDSLLELFVLVFVGAVTYAAFVLAFRPLRLEVRSGVRSFLD